MKQQMNLIEKILDEIQYRLDGMNSYERENIGNGSIEDWGIRQGRIYAHQDIYSLILQKQTELKKEI